MKTVFCIFVCCGILTGVVASAGGAGEPFDPSRLSAARIAVPGVEDRRPEALTRLMWEVAKRTSVEVNLEPAVVRPGDPDLWRIPLLYLGGRGTAAPLTIAERENLSRVLRRGGLLFIDDQSEPGDDRFDAWIRGEIPKLGLGTWETLPHEHVFFRTFFILRKTAGRLVRTPLEAVQYANRAVVLYQRNDVAGAYEKDGLGNWRWSVVPGGEEQREWAFRLGINWVMYALCLDYKSDAVHLPFLQQREK